MEQRRVWLLLVVATVVAAAIRLPLLSHQSLWLDEVLTRSIVSEPTLAGVWRHVQATESTPPLYYVLAWLLGGRSAASLRLVPALALIASVPVTYLAFRRFVGSGAALATAAIVAVSPELVEYSLDARSYGLLVLAGLVSLWAFGCVLEDCSRRRYLAWAAASIACVWTHYFGVFLVGAEIIVLVAIRPAARKTTLGWSVVVGVFLAPLIPLIAQQNGDERAEFIAGVPLKTRLIDTGRQFAMGSNVPRTWLEAAGLAIAVAPVVAGTVWVVHSGTRQQRALLAVAVLALTMPLLIAVLGIEDRFYDRNLLFLLPVAAALAAPILLRLRAIPLVVYLALATLTSLWVATNWRYENTDWRAALARAKSTDPSAALIAVPQSQGELVAQFYAGRVPATTTVFTRRAWVIVEPWRAPHIRALGPAPLPTAFPAGVPGFTTLRQLDVHGFRLILIGAASPRPVDPAKLPGATVFAQSP